MKLTYFVPDFLNKWGNKIQNIKFYRIGRFLGPGNAILTETIYSKVYYNQRKIFDQTQTAQAHTVHIELRF